LPQDAEAFLLDSAGNPVNRIVAVFD